MMGTLDIIANTDRPKNNLNVYRTMTSSLWNTSRFVCVEDRFLLRCFFSVEGVGIDDGLNGIGMILPPVAVLMAICVRQVNPVGRGVFRMAEAQRSANLFPAVRPPEATA